MHRLSRRKLPQLLRLVGVESIVELRTDRSLSLTATDAELLHCDGKRGYRPAELVRRIKRVRSSGGWVHDDAGAANRTRSRRNDAVRLRCP